MSEVTIKNQDEAVKMRAVGRIVYEVLEAMKEWIRPGITTAELDRLATEMILARGAKPSFKGYEGYPACICTSIDAMVIHGIPDRNTVLKEGSIISVDVGAVKDGFHGDAARTYPIGKVSEEDLRLIQNTERAFFRGVAIIKPGRHLYEISSMIHKEARAHRLGIVRDYTGHGIGRSMHEDPLVPNYRPLGYPLRRGLKLKCGMALAIEPMLTLGHSSVDTLDDGWGVITRDGKKAAHYENTVLITETGFEILTLGEGSTKSINLEDLHV